MNWKQSLGRRKFYSIFAASAVEMVVGILSALLDTVITGHIIGTVGLSAMNMLNPVVVFTMFTEGLFAVGTSIVYAGYKGKYEEEKADATFGTGFVCSVCMGLVTALALICLMQPYLTYMGVSDTIREIVNGYLIFVYPQMALAPAYRLINQMVLTDGGEVTGTAGIIAETLLNLVLSVILGRAMGVLGIGLGTLISTLVGLGITLLHFLSKRNSLRIRFGFDMGDVKKMCLFGVNDSAMFFLLPIMSLVITKFVLLRFGEFYLPVLTIIYSVFEITAVFEATGEAMRPIMPIYTGDHNIDAVRNLLKSSLFTNLMLSGAFFLFLFLGGSYIPLAFDIKDPVLLEECTFAMRIYAFAGPALAVSANFNSYYLNTGKTLLAVMENVLRGLVCILILAIPLGIQCGIRGMMLGFSLAPYLTVAILFAFIFLRYGREQFPILMTPSGDVLLNRTILLDQENIMSLVYDTHVFLEENNVSKSSQNRVELTMEELLLLIRDRNSDLSIVKKARQVFAECCVRISSDGVDMSVWDSGEIFDVTEVDGDIINFRAYFVERFLSVNREKKHMIATSFNKNFCHFKFR